jgi:TolA-binding protein
MNFRALLIALLSLVGLGTLWAVVAQHQRLTNLRAQQNELVTNAETAASTNASGTPETEAASSAVPLELLRLRNEVAQLNRRVRELSAARSENERLHAQAGAHLTNSVPGKVLPAGYIRKSQARMAGFNTPEDTLQTFLWALANRDLDTLYQTLIPEAAQQMQAVVQRSGTERFFEEARSLPGAAITGRQLLSDGSTELMVQFVPDLPTNRISARLINGQWKINLPR